MFLITETLSFVHFFSSKKTKSVERHKKLLVQLSICSTSSQKSIFSKLADICNKNNNKVKQKNIFFLLEILNKFVYPTRLSTRGSF